MKTPLLVAVFALSATLLGCTTVPVIPPPAPFSPAPPVAQMDASRAEAGLTTTLEFVTSPSARYTWLRDDLPWLAVTIGAHQGYLQPVLTQSYIGGGGTLWLRPGGEPGDGVRFAFGPGAQLSLGDLWGVDSALPGVGADLNAQVAWRWRGRHLLSLETSAGYATHLRSYKPTIPEEDEGAATVEHQETTPLYSQDLQIRYDFIGDRAGGFVGLGGQLINTRLEGYTWTPLPTMSAGVSW